MAGGIAERLIKFPASWMFGEMIGFQLRHGAVFLDRGRAAALDAGRALAGSAR